MSEYSVTGAVILGIMSLSGLYSTKMTEPIITSAAASTGNLRLFLNSTSASRYFLKGLRVSALSRLRRPAINPGGAFTGSMALRLFLYAMRNSSSALHLSHPERCSFSSLSLAGSIPLSIYAAISSWASLHFMAVPLQGAPAACALRAPAWI